MKLAVVDAADRNSKLIAHSASESARLGKGEVMGVGGHAAAHEATLSEHEFSVILIA